jgi:hypothetical protein
MTETAKDLVQQGLTAARVGDTEEARRLLTQATQQVPESVEAWLALAGVVEPLVEKRRCFAEALKLDPANDEARAGLALVEQKLAPQDAIPSTVGEGAAQPETKTGVGYCYRHPQTETGLRCNRCNKFICPKCARRTPVGFRCPDCIREQEDRYYSGGNIDYVIAAVIALPLSLIAAGLFTTILGGLGLFLTLILGSIVTPVVVGVIVEAVRWGVKKRRSRYLRHVVIGSFILGTAPFLILSLTAGFLGGGFWALIAPSLFLFLGVATISARLR